MRNRIGRIFIPRILLDSDFALIQQVMSRCVPVRCELLYAEDVFEYTAISGEFRELDEGELTPSYDMDFEQGKFIGFREKPHG